MNVPPSFFSAIYTKGDNFCGFLFGSMDDEPYCTHFLSAIGLNSEWGHLLKGRILKELYPLSVETEKVAELLPLKICPFTSIKI